MDRGQVDAFHIHRIAAVEVFLGHVQHRLVHVGPAGVVDHHIEPAELAPYFSSVSVHSFEVDGVRFWYADGQNFNYAVYRERILKTIADRYYRIPSFLPMTGCPFLERYDLPRP